MARHGMQEGGGAVGRDEVRSERVGACAAG